MLTNNKHLWFISEALRNILAMGDTTHRLAMPQMCDLWFLFFCDRTQLLTGSLFKYSFEWVIVLGEGGLRCRTVHRQCLFIYLFSWRNSVLQTVLLGSPSAVTQGAETRYGVSVRAKSWAYVLTNWSINMFLKCSPKPASENQTLSKQCVACISGTVTLGRVTDPGACMEFEGIEHGLRFVEFSQWFTGPADQFLWCFAAWWPAQCPQGGMEI